LKCSNSEVGKRLNYLYDGSCFRLYALPDDYSVVTAAQMRRDQAGGDDGEI
jgi:hypothetical protein